MNKPAVTRPTRAGVQLVRRLAREHTVESIDRIAKLMRMADKDATSLAAAQTLLAYGHGKPGNASDNPEREYLSTLLAARGRNMSVPEFVQFILGRIEAMQGYLEELGRMTEAEQEAELRQLVGGVQSG